jgi:uncharacterized protein YdeI (YjbR/CyaY-like superfamily)
MIRSTTAAPRAFPSPAAFRKWLARNHGSAPALVVRCFKVHVAGRGLSYSEALDEALCFGWIDGVRRRIDEGSFSVRFSPRKPRSIWSRVNIRRVEALIEASRMAPAGLAAFRSRTAERSGVYSFEQRSVVLKVAYVRLLRANKAAWAHFKAQAPWYQRTSSYWIMSAKREATQVRRLEILLTCSERGATIPVLTRKP